MSVSPHPRPAHPFFRQAACFTIGFGCLLMAGTVLSSVVQAPVHHRSETSANLALSTQPVYALPVPPNTSVADPQPLMALVRFHHGFMQVTNNSYYPWRNVQVLSGDSPLPELRVTACPLILPYQTYDIPLKSFPRVPRLNGYGCYSLSLCWECRTDRESGKWRGSLVR